MNLSRRSFFAGAAGLIAAPSIVRVSSIMPVSIVGLGHLSGEMMYGRSPAMDAIADVRSYNALLRDVLVGNEPAFLRMMHNIGTALAPQLPG